MIYSFLRYFSYFVYDYNKNQQLDAYNVLIYEYEINDYLDYARNSGITIVIQQIQLQNLSKIVKDILELSIIANLNQQGFEHLVTFIHICKKQVGRQVESWILQLSLLSSIQHVVKRYYYNKYIGISYSKFIIKKQR